MLRLWYQGPCASELAPCKLICRRLQEMHENALVSTQCITILYEARENKIELAIAILVCIARNRSAIAVAMRARDSAR